MRRNKLVPLGLLALALLVNTGCCPPSALGGACAQGALANLGSSALQLGAGAASACSGGTCRSSCPGGTCPLSAGGMVCRGGTCTRVPASTWTPPAPGGGAPGSVVPAAADTGLVKADTTPSK